jgi:hypothetical protein
MRRWRAGAGFLVVVVLSGATLVAQTTAPATSPAIAIEQWGMFELALNGPAEGHPFDAKLSAEFTSGSSSVNVNGFYDGQGVYRIRFMPPRQGVWKYATKSDRPELAGKSGEFMCGKPSAGNHGPVVVRNQFHFAYADGTPFVPISTTLYGWVNQRSEELQETTLASLRALPFNRVRMAVLPINYGDDNVPRYFPFEENADESWNYARFDPRFFQHIEKRLGDLRDLGIEAELILFHSRDGGKTELDRMPAATDDRYLRYVVARFSAFRNVWWNLANEFDAMRFKRDSDWQRFFEIIAAEDPVGHPRAIHQMRRYFNPTSPLVTYMSVQSSTAVAGFGRPQMYRQICGKPVVFDEVQYEGDIPQSWGHLSGEELVLRFWMGTIGGVYVTHGETYTNPQGVAWISRGGSLVGQSPKRIAFLKEILSTAPAEGINPLVAEDTYGIAGRSGEWYLVYFGKNKPTEWAFESPVGRIRAGSNFHVDVLDTWNMTITPIEQPVTIRTPATQGGVTPDPPVKIPLPGKPYMALRIRRAS